jgi:hypothetical protein
MSLPSAHLDLAEQVEVLFTVVRGRGLALGALDRELSWPLVTGRIPLQVVARGLLRAAERARWNGPAGATPRSLARVPTGGETRRSRPGSCALSVAERTMVSEGNDGCLKTGGLLEEGVFARMIPLATSMAMVIRTCAQGTLEHLAHPALRSGTRRASSVPSAARTTPRIWGRRD